MKRMIYVAALAAVLCWSCRKPGPDPVRPVDPDNPESLWIMENDPVERVDVYVGRKLVESWAFEYDDVSRVTAVTRTDEVAGVVLYDLKYSYEGQFDMALSGNFSASVKGSLKASVDEDDWNLVYNGDWNDAVMQKVEMDEDMPVKAGWTYGFDARGGQYSSSVEKGKKYSEENGDIVSVLETTSWSSKTDKRTSAKSSSSIETLYTYSDREDLQNFGVWLMSCDFPVWYAKELPGCAHLITGMTMKRGDVVLPESFTVEYEFNDNGSIKAATRTDYSCGEKVVERRYVISYL